MSVFLYGQKGGEGNPYVVGETVNFKTQSLVDFSVLHSDANSQEHDSPETFTASFSGVLTIRANLRYSNWYGRSSADDATGDRVYYKRNGIRNDFSWLNGTAGGNAPYWEWYTEDIEVTKGDTIVFGIYAGKYNRSSDLIVNSQFNCRFHILLDTEKKPLM